MLFTQDHLHKIEEGLRLFNEQKYWECHEVLEDQWMEDRDDNARYIYWAIIQVAAACIHYRNQNLPGAQGMITKAKEKFRRSRELNLLGTVVMQKLDWEELESLVMKIPKGSASRLEDFSDLFDFRFNSYLGEK